MRRSYRTTLSFRLINLLLLLVINKVSKNNFGMVNFQQKNCTLYYDIYHLYITDSRRCLSTSSRTEVEGKTCFVRCHPFTDDIN